MIKKLTKHAEGLALVLDEQMLAQLGVDENTALDVTIDGGVLSVAPAEDAERARRFEAALEETNQRFGRALRRLAE